MANTAVMAETKAAGPEISIETDRTEYSSTDPINETVKIYNASDDILTDIVISGSIPEGYQTEDGVASPDQWEMKTGDVGSGGTGECTVRLVRKTSGTDQEQGGAQIPGGTDTDRPDKDTDPGNRPDSDGTGDKETVQTGDTANIIPWCIAGAVSFCVIIAAVRKRRNREQRRRKRKQKRLQKRY